MVVRRDDTNSHLWYYGVYETYEEAEDVAVEIGNGIVVQLGGADGEKA
jgi:hypothetical protein